MQNGLTIWNNQVSSQSNLETKTKHE
jgi:hypothetical protein